MTLPPQSGHSRSASSIAVASIGRSPSIISASVSDVTIRPSTTRLLIPPVGRPTPKKFLYTLFKPPGGQLVDQPAHLPTGRPASPSTSQSTTRLAGATRYNHGAC